MSSVFCRILHEIHLHLAHLYRRREREWCDSRRLSICLSERTLLKTFSGSFCWCPRFLGDSDLWLSKDPACSAHETTNLHALPLSSARMFGFWWRRAPLTLASAVVWFFCGALMAALAMALTVRAVLASKSRRRQSPSCLFSPRLQTPAQTQTLAPAAPHIVFMPFRRFGCKR